MAISTIPRARRRAPVAAAHSERGPSFRPEIEGLRAVAVLLVVADHLGAKPRGGFIGVDVFFVISLGFLITSLLIKEKERTGRISIKGFYQRRVRRILPAAVTVLASTWVVSSLVFFAARARDAHNDIVWSAVFLANLHFARAGTDYFNADKPPSPVQHFWSLAVEEQFYLFWPLILIVLFGLFRRLLPRRERAGIFAMTLVVVGVLFVLAVQQTTANRTTAYFNTSARAWELGVGAVLACGLPYLRRLPAWFCSAFMGIGLLTILVSAFVISTNSAFPAPIGALPVLGAAAVIVGTATRFVSPFAWPLTNPVSRYVGRVSYSLYLWHWPTIIILSAETSSKTTFFKVVAILTMSALTIASYHLVESPMRQLRLADLLKDSRRRDTHEYGWTEKRRAIFAVAIVVELIAVVWVERPQSTPKIFASPSVVDAASSNDAPGAHRLGVLDPPANITAAITSALAATSWPKLTPSVGNLSSGKAPEWKSCGNVGAGQVAACTFPAGATAGGPHTAVVIGDSIAISWLPTVRAALQPLGWTVVALTYGQCPAVDVSIGQSVGAASSFTSTCNAHRTWSFNEIKQLKPGLVIMSDAENSLSRLADKATGAAALSEWQAGLTRTLTTIQQAGAKQIVVLSPPPAAQSLEACATADSTPGDCVSQTTTVWQNMSDVEYKAATAARTRYVDTELLFCSAAEYCPAFIGKTPIRIDGDHLVAGYARQLGPVLAKSMTG